MEDPTVWNAVNALADKLRAYWPTAEQVGAHGGWDIGRQPPLDGRPRGRLSSRPTLGFNGSFQRRTLLREGRARPGKGHS